MNTADVIKQRRSVRAFENRLVPDQAIRTMIEAAVCAPSASNRQPWRFMVLSDPEVRGRLADCVREAIAETAREVLPEYAANFQAYSRYFLLFELAPTLIFALVRANAVMAEFVRANTPAHRRMTDLETTGAMISVSMAVQNMLLSATDQGLGTCVMTGPLIAAESFNHVLSIPEGWTILCMVCVGYAAEPPSPAHRKAVDQVLVRPPNAGESKP